MRESGMGETGMGRQGWGDRDGGRQGWGESGMGRDRDGGRDKKVRAGCSGISPKPHPLSYLRELWVSLQVGGHLSQPPTCPLDTQGAGARLNLFSGQISGPRNHSQTPPPSSNVCLEPGGASF